MKNRRLPEIDLARIAPLPPDLQKHKLRSIKFFRPKYDYNPFRSLIRDIVNEQPPLFASGEHRSRTPWATISMLLDERSANQAEFEVNLAVAKSLFEFSASQHIEARHGDFSPTSLAIGIKVEYWLRTILIEDGRLTIPFIDPRRTNGLNADGRRFAFSMMHERIRALDPDLSDAKLAIIQFGCTKKNKRPLRIFYDEDYVLYNFDQLEQMVEVTYRLWWEVLEEREEEIRKAGGAPGSLI